MGNAVTRVAIGQSALRGFLAAAMIVASIPANAEILNLDCQLHEEPGFPVHLNFWIDLDASTLSYTNVDVSTGAIHGSPSMVPVNVTPTEFLSAGRIWIRIDRTTGAAIFNNGIAQEWDCSKGDRPLPSPPPPPKTKF